MVGSWLRIPTSLLHQFREVNWYKNNSLFVRITSCLLHSLSLLKKMNRVFLTNIMSGDADLGGENKGQGKPLMLVPKELHCISSIIPTFSVMLSIFKFSCFT